MKTLFFNTIGAMIGLLILDFLGVITINAMAI
jgi:hypothetical protein